jgi:hypothetical protein
MMGEYMDLLDGHLMRKELVPRKKAAWRRIICSAVLGVKDS